MSQYFEAMRVGFLSELEKIAQDRSDKPSPLTGGQKALAFLAGGPGGYLGAMKGNEHGEALEGGIRGAGGAALGGGLGSYLGQVGGRALGGAIGGHQSGAALAGTVLGGLAGQVGGGIAGYKALTHKYNQPPVE